MEKRLEKFRQNTQETIFLKNIRKKAFEATYNGDKSRGFGKIHTKKCILGKIQWRKIAFGVRYNGEKVRQNTQETIFLEKYKRKKGI